MAVLRTRLDDGRMMLALRTLATMVVYGLALLAVMVLAAQGVTLGQRQLDEVRYGYPRRVHLSGYVGHNDAQALQTHFVAFNLDGRVSILEIPGGDIERLQVLHGPYVVGVDGPYVVPQLALEDMNGDGHVDLLLTLRGETVVYVNDAGAFRLLREDERADIVEQPE